ncbi:hypothetical protein QL217_16260 [Cronobacter malonaticus]|uniref:hypothetical protein n=1 Tax=Cronobacter malonaticus TaxID=413503 RepID=UPI0024ADBD25|nr:hypothetical protein [Cronobacter malonaticus]ELY4807020.1 hypothetical protein [Cronobacter malonaticus]MDI6406309.1 hypothetical protein [Cronobacter malonaticus]
MSEMSKEALAAACEEKVKQLEFSVKQSAFDSVRQELETELAIARVALLALRKEREAAVPAGYRYRFRPTSEAAGKWILVETIEEANPLPKYEIQPLYTTPPAQPVAVPDETFDEWSRRCEIQLTLCRPEFREVAEISWNACRAAMLAAPGKEG